MCVFEDGRRYLFVMSEADHSGEGALPQMSEVLKLAFAFLLAHFKFGSSPRSLTFAPACLERLNKVNRLVEDARARARHRVNMPDFGKLMDQVTRLAGMFALS